MSKLSALKKEARRAEERDDFIEAIELYGRAVTAAQEDPSATFEVGLYNRIGDLYLKLDDTSQAVYHYLLAVDQYAEDELYPPAIALCRKVLRVAPDQVDAYRKLARLHEATGLMADAREEMGRYLAGLWDAGQVNGALEGLPELVARLMSGAPDVAEIHRLRDEGESEEAFELLYRQWEDDKAGWKNGNGAHASDEVTEENAGTGFPQTDPSDRSLGESLRRGWQGLFGGDEDEEADAPPVLDLGEVEAAREENGTDDADVDSELDDVDDMAWLQEVTSSARAAADEEHDEAADDEDEAAAAGTDEAGDVDEAEQIAAGTDEVEESDDDLDVAAAAGEETAAEAEAGEDEAADESIDLVAAAMQEPAAGDAEAEAEAEDPEPVEASDAVAEAADADAEAAQAEGETEADDDEIEPAAAPLADEPEPVEEPAGPPAEVLVAAAASLSRDATMRPELTGDVAAPMLLAAADADVPEGRTAVADRPLDRAVRARIRRPADRRPGGRPPEGPAFETPGREDYLPAGAEVTARAPSPGMLWLSDQVALLGAMDRQEPIAVKPAFGPPLELIRSAAEALDRAATVEPVAALPADVAAPALLGAGVAEEPWVAEPVVEDAPRPRAERRPPEGPAFETPGRDDYLPAGAEIGARLPAAALSWLADAVDHLHRLEWGEPAWLTAAREARSRAAAALSELAADPAPRAALPANVGRPLLLAAAREDVRGADAVADEDVEQMAVPAAEVDVTRPAAAASGAGPGTPDPDGPSFQTPGRDDYLPAGAEAAEGLPSPALAWLAASVADIHRLDWGEPSWFDADAPGPADADASEVRVDGIDAPEEAAARATQDALALIAAEKAATVPPAEAEDADEDEASSAEAAVEHEQAAESADADEPAEDEAPAAEAAEDEAPEPAVEPEAADEAGPSVETAARAAAGPAEEPEPASYPEPASDRGPFDEPDVTPPVEQPAVQPNGLDFTALLQHIGWLRGEKNGRREKNGSGRARPDVSSEPPKTDDVMAPWARGPSGDEPTSGDGGRDGDGTADLQPPTVGAPGSGVPDFTDLLQKVGWLRQDERT